MSSSFAMRLHLTTQLSVSRYHANTKETAPIRVARVNNGGPIFIRRAVNAIHELTDERSSALEAYRGTVLQRSAEIEPTVARSRLVRDLDTCRAVLIGTE